MKPSSAKLVVEGLKEAGVTLVACVPDSWMWEVYHLISQDKHFKSVAVCNEGEGVAICSGAWLGGKKAVMLMENSGLRVASEALGRLFGAPVMMFMGYRGDMGDGNWWSVPIGTTTEPMLHALKIPYAIVTSEDEIKKSIGRA